MNPQIIQVTSQNSYVLNSAYAGPWQQDASPGARNPYVTGISAAGQQSGYMKYNGYK